MKKSPLFLALATIILLLIGAVAFFTIVPGEVAKRMNRVVSLPPYDVSERARQLHQSLFIADLHADSLLWNRDLLDYGTYGHIDIPRLIEGNVVLQAFTVVTKVPRGRKIDGGTPSDSLDLITLLSISQLWPVSTWMSL
ncbi:MAG: peptidase M19, partial [Candidatus Binatia bacterium]